MSKTMEINSVPLTHKHTQIYISMCVCVYLLAYK